MLQARLRAAVLCGFLDGVVGQDQIGVPSAASGLHEPQGPFGNPR
jgi:hypothetical protein